MNTKHLIITFALLLGLTIQTGAQERTGVWSTAFYNLENLFDTEDDPDNRGDDEFLPTGPYAWTENKYQQKLANIARTLSEIGRPTCPVGPAIIGLAEVENRRVLEDLVARPELTPMTLRVIHYQSPDRRGIDVAMLYNPRLFRPDTSFVYPYNFPDEPEYVTRDILVVVGKMANEPFAAIVGHWPSRYGGEKSSVYRERAGQITRHIYDSLMVANPKTKVIICGDFNDDPSNKSCAEALGASRKAKDTPKGGLFNATWPIYDRGIGTLCYQDSWNLFDQQVVSQNLLTDEPRELKYWKAEVFNPPFLLNQEGKYKGYPLRTFSGTVFQNGYSDHFPTIVYYKKSF